MKVFVLGYSSDPSRYSYMAYNLLKDYKHEAIAINPTEIVAESNLRRAKDKFGQPHTLTMYVRPTISDKMIDDILEVAPKRVIFNPGTENQNLINRLKNANIEVVTGCTLIMLKTNQF